MKTATVKPESVNPGERNRIAKPLDAFRREKTMDLLMAVAVGFT